MWRTLAAFTLTHEHGGENVAAERSLDAVGDLDLPPACLERFKAAVTEAVRHAMSHSSAHRSDWPVSIRVLVSNAGATASVPGCGQTHLGWGFFAVKKMIKDSPDARDVPQYEIEFYLYREGAPSD
jgi:hypothetical protein